MNKLPAEKEKEKILIKKKVSERKKEKKTVEEMIKYGIVNIDKPKGPTSHQVSDYVQKILKIKKSGHSGTLDPGVTGVLPVALGRATRIVQAILKAGKEYVCIMHLHKEVPEKQIRKVMKKFTGKIKQRPPIKSAVKRVERYREIYYLEILEIDGKDVLFKIGCEAGTYIRVYCHQIGQILETGAHMAELRRTKAGPFSEETTVTLQELTDALHYYNTERKEKLIRKCIQPIETAVEHLQKIWVMENAVESIVHGVDLKIPGITKLDSKIEPDQTIAVMNSSNELVALGVAQLTSKKMFEGKKGIAIRINKVFMK